MNNIYKKTWETLVQDIDQSFDIFSRSKMQVEGFSSYLLKRKIYEAHKYKSTQDIYSGYLLYNIKSIQVINRPLIYLFFMLLYFNNIIEKRKRRIQGE